MAYEWDPAKASLNFKKHGVRFANAVTTFEDDLALTIRDPYSEEEERWITVGMDSFGRVLLVFYAWRGQTIRLVSARRATVRERRQYGEHHET